MLSVTKHFKQPKILEDCYDVFGKNVIMRLHDLLNNQRIIAQKLISDVLFAAEMGTLTTSTSLTSTLRMPLMSISNAAQSSWQYNLQNTNNSQTDEFISLHN